MTRNGYADDDGDEPELTIVKTQDDSDLDFELDDVEVDVHGDVPDGDLADAVHDALKRTIIHLLDGRSVKWHQVEGRRGPDYKFEIIGGMPEGYGGELGRTKPPYMTREKFEGADASGDGLMGNLPDGWAYEVERGDSVFGFYRID